MVGLGAYPGTYCYDASRPDWLPYWIDSATESMCFYDPSTIAGNIAACFTGSVTCGKPNAAMQDPTLSGPGIAPAGSPSNVPKCPTGQAYNPSTNQCQFDLSAIPLGAWIAGGLLVAVVVPPLLRR